MKIWSTVCTKNIFQEQFGEQNQFSSESILMGGSVLVLLMVLFKFGSLIMFGPQGFKIFPYVIRNRKDF